jgi:hypothetical protein
MAHAHAAPCAQAKAALAPASGRVVKKPNKGFRIKKNGARSAPRLLLSARTRTATAHLVHSSRLRRALTHALRHAVMVKGVMIKDADSKNKALKRLKAEQAMAMATKMDTA